MTPKEFIETMGLSTIADNTNKHPKSGSDYSIRDLLEKFERLNNVKDLQHHYDTTKGLWATDRPDLINDPQKILFQI